MLLSEYLSLKLVLVIIFLLTGGIIIVDATSAIGGSGTGVGSSESLLYQQSELSFDERDSIVPKTANTTVVSSQKGMLVAFSPDGRVSFYTDQMDSYWDVDPVPNNSDTVLVTASKNIPNNRQESVIMKINISTHKTQILHQRIVPDTDAVLFHDADYIGNGKYAVADIDRDSMFLLNSSKSTIIYQWNMDSEFSSNSGGVYPEDWTHMNDVEMIQDNQLINETVFMLSPRNHDQVIFISRQDGMHPALTIGGDDEYQIMYEQHNPDYIHSKRGGPAVLIADSQNNRIVEYQRQNQSWDNSWEWSDSNMQWPRDADRLPNGNTLIADSIAGRVIEVNQSGEVIWQASVPLNYDVERLETGDESRTGESARYLNLSSTVSQDRITADSPVMGIKQIADLGASIVLSMLPQKVENGIRFAAPTWMGSAGIVAVGINVISVILFILLKAHQSRYTLQFPVKNRS